MANIIDFCDDYSLFDKYICGDKEAGELLFSKTFPIVEKYVYNKTKELKILNNQDREEIVSESFCRAIDKRFDLRKGTKFATFVIGFSKNVIKEKCREKVKHDKIISLEQPFGESELEFIDIISDITLEGKNPLDIIIKDYEIKQVKKAFDELPQNYQEIIILRIFRRQKIVDIARFSNQTPEAVRSLYRRAIDKLKENLKK